MSLNIMMDGRPLFPNSCHPDPWSNHKTRDLKAYAKHYERTSHPVRYYFIDFGLSVSFDPEDPVATGVVGQDRSVPEFKAGSEVQYNPTKLDIYQLGNAFKQHLLEVLLVILYSRHPLKFF